MTVLTVRSLVCLMASVAMAALAVSPKPRAQTPPSNPPSSAVKPTDGGSAYANLGQVMKLLEGARINEAVEFLEELTRSDVGGANRKQIVQRRTMEIGLLASLYSGQGRHAAAEKLLRDMIRVGDTGAKLSGMDALASFFVRVGRVDDARALWEESEKLAGAEFENEITSKFYGATSVSAAIRASKLARAYAELGLRDQAQAFAARARSTIEKHIRADTSLPSDIIRRRAILSDLGYGASSLSSITVNIAASIAPFDLDAAVHSQTSSLLELERLGERIERLQSQVLTQPIEDLKEKRDIFKAPLRTCTRCLLLEPLGSLGKLLEKKERYEEAEAFYRRAVSIIEDIYGANAPRGVDAYQRLATALARQDEPGKLAEAIRLRQMTLSIRLSALKPTVLHNILAMEELVSLHAKVGEIAEADALRRRATEARTVANERALQDPDLRYHREIKIVFGTTRARDTNDMRAPFGAVPTDTLGIGLAQIRAPYLERRPGSLGTPARLQIPWTGAALELQWADPLRHFALRSALNTTKEEALQQARDALAKATIYKDTVIIFVHGFQTRLEEAALWYAQILEDLQFDGAAFLFSWPSKGELSSTAYNADIERARNSRRSFVQFVEEMVRPLRGKKVHVIAHSMGNLVLLAALRDLKQMQKPNEIFFDQLILAAPDVERREFADMWQDSKGVARNATLYAASTDFAMLMSRRHRGNDSPRAGDVLLGTGPLVLDGVDTIDISALAQEFFAMNHASFAEKPRLIADMKAVLQSSQSAAERAKASGLTHEKDGSWRMAP